MPDWHGFVAIAELLHSCLCVLPRKNEAHKTWNKEKKNINRKQQNILNTKLYLSFIYKKQKPFLLKSWGKTRVTWLGHGLLFNLFCILFFLWEVKEEQTREQDS